MVARSSVRRASTWAKRRTISASRLMVIPRRSSWLGPWELGSLWPDKELAVAPVEEACDAWAGGGGRGSLILGDEDWLFRDDNVAEQLSSSSIPGSLRFKWARLGDVDALIVIVKRQTKKRGETKDNVLWNEVGSIENDRQRSLSRRRKLKEAWERKETINVCRSAGRRCYEQPPPLPTAFELVY